MELDESAEREKLVSDEEDELLEAIPAVLAKPSTQSVIHKTPYTGTTGGGGGVGPVTAASSYREPTVVVVNNALQKSTVASSSTTATASSMTAPLSPKSSTGGGPASSGGVAPTTARLSFVNERSGSTHSKTHSTSTEKTIKPRKIQREPTDTPSTETLLSSSVPPRPPPPNTLLSSTSPSGDSGRSHRHRLHAAPHHPLVHSKGGPVADQPQSSSMSFSDRGLKHHSFLLSEVPDVRHMEQALLGLLDDFHSGKLRAFGSGTMDQMTNIREQQERLAKLHFELGGAVENMMMSSDEDSIGSGNSTAGHETIAQENMTRLVKQLEALSVSIEGLHSDS